MEGLGIRSRPVLHFWWNLGCASQDRSLAVAFKSSSYAASMSLSENTGLGELANLHDLKSTVMRDRLFDKEIQELCIGKVIQMVLIGYV